jgi:hypothetical protein
MTVLKGKPLYFTRGIEYLLLHYHAIVPGAVRVSCPDIIFL